MIKMSINNIRKSMSYERKILDWKNIYTTNCYAYAMGIDIPQTDICKYAYDVGQISRMIDCEDEEELPDPKYHNTNTFEWELTWDFDTLGLEFEESSKIELKPDEIPNYPGRYFDILFFIHKYRNDFHFARFGKDGKLYHKRGFNLAPQETTVDFIESDNYEFAKRYRLYLSKGPFYK